MRLSVVMWMLSGLLLVGTGTSQAQGRKLRGPARIALHRAKRLITLQNTRMSLGRLERRTLKAVVKKQPAVGEHASLMGRVNRSRRKGQRLALEWAARGDVKNGKLQGRAVRPNYPARSKEGRLITQLDRMNDVLWSDKAQGNKPMGEGLNITGDVGTWRQVKRARRWVSVAINQMVNLGNYDAARQTLRQARRELTIYKAKQRNGTLDLTFPLRVLDAYASLLVQ